MLCIGWENKCDSVLVSFVLFEFVGFFKSMFFFSDKVIMVFFKIFVFFVV